VLSGVRDVLGDLRKKVQRIKYLEIPAETRPQTVAVRVGKAPAVLMLGPVDNLPRGGYLHDPVETKRTTGYILHKPLDGIAVSSMRTLPSTQY
jgi:hypothetical protein